MTLAWRRTWPDDPGPDFVLERARERDEPEIVGRIMMVQRHRAAEAEGWSWSLTSVARPVGIARPDFATAGLAAERQAAADALKEAWDREAAWRAEIVAAGLPEGMAPEMRRFLTHGQPAPLRRTESSQGSGSV